MLIVIEWGLEIFGNFIERMGRDIILRVLILENIVVFELEHILEIYVLIDITTNLHTYKIYAHMPTL